MKKQIFFLVMMIVALTAAVNLSSCKKKDEAPAPANVECAKTYLNVVFSSDWSVEYTINAYAQKYRDTLISNGFTGVYGVQPNAAGCENNGSTVHYHFWNSDSSVVVLKDLYCPPNDTVYYNLQ